MSSEVNHRFIAIQGTDADFFVVVALHFLQIIKKLDIHFSIKEVMT